MLRMIYLALLYWWYGGNLRDLVEGTPDDLRDSGQDSNSTSSSSNTAPSLRRRSSQGQEPAIAGCSVRDRTSVGDIEGDDTPANQVQGAPFAGDGCYRDLKRAIIYDKMAALTLLMSLVSDLDLITDWIFIAVGLEGQSRLVRAWALAFTVVGTIVYVLLTVEFHLVNEVWTCCCRGGAPLSPLQHVPLGWQLLMNVVVEDVPQLIITIAVVGPTSAAGVSNLIASCVSVLAKLAVSFATRKKLPMSSLLRMIETNPGVVRHTLVQQREAARLAANAARLAVLVNRFDRKKKPSAGEGETKTRSKGLALIAFQVGQSDHTFMNGGLNYVREQLEFAALDLSFHKLEGSIPKEVDTFLTSLTSLNLSGNNLTGAIPSSMGRLGQLKRLNLHKNRLTGTIPPELGSLSELASLAISRNRLTGGIPSQLGMLTELESLYLGENRLTGTIPVALGNLTKLKELGLSRNKLSGGIPRELGQLVHLEKMWLQKNELTGDIPEELGALRQLRCAFLGRNKFSDGEVDKMLDRLPKRLILRSSVNKDTETDDCFLDNPRRSGPRKESRT